MVNHNHKRVTPMFGIKEASLEIAESIEAGAHEVAQGLGDLESSLEQQAVDMATRHEELMDAVKVFVELFDKLVEATK